ncbi:hypothetical protein CDAR_203701, partial [Caerostris darwini]
MKHLSLSPPIRKDNPQLGLLRSPVKCNGLPILPRCLPHFINSLKCETFFKLDKSLLKVDDSKMATLMNSISQPSDS